MDYRLKENRRELFIRWFIWSIAFKDCDPAVWMTNYLNKRYEHNDEERFWLAWLYGNTYQLPTAWVIKNEFPDFELATVSRMTNWNTANYKRLRYQTDTKWNKGHLPVMFESYQQFIGNRSQREKFESLYGDNERYNFNNIWNAVKGDLHKFGRYSTWFYMQHLKHTCGLQIEPTSLMLDDYSGSQSHRNGLCLALGKDDFYDVKLDTHNYANLESASADIIAEMKSRFPKYAAEVNYYTMETCLCSFKKIFRATHGRYLGYYLDRQAEEILQAEQDGWTGIDWNVLWQARAESLEPILDRKTGVDKSQYSYFLDTGTVKNLPMMFKDEPEESTGFFDQFYK